MQADAGLHGGSDLRRKTDDRQEPPLALSGAKSAESASGVNMSEHVDPDAQFLWPSRHARI